VLVRAAAVALMLLVAGCTSSSVTAIKQSPGQTASPVASAPPPTQSSPSPTPQLEPDALRSVRMTSLYVMWAATVHQVFRSVNGGGRWSEVTPPGAHSGAAFFALSDTAAWFVDTTFGPSAPFDVWRTTNGGASWAEARGTAPGFVMGAYFVDRTHGWITVSGGAATGSMAVSVLRSSNGGASWSTVATSGDPSSTQPNPSGLAFACDKETATFASATVGLLPIACAGGGPDVYRTVDGGAHWKSVALPRSKNPQMDGGEFGRPIFITAASAVMSGAYYAVTLVPTMMATSDGGATWRAFPLPGGGSLDFESPGSGWLLSDPIRATTDGGATWHTLNVPAPPFKPTDMTLQFLGRGVAVAWSDQQAFRTDDGGQTWRAVVPPGRILN